MPTATLHFVEATLFSHVNLSHMLQGAIETRCMAVARKAAIVKAIWETGDANVVRATERLLMCSTKAETEHLLEVLASKTPECHALLFGIMEERAREVGHALAMILQARDYDRCHCRNVMLL